MCHTKLDCGKSESPSFIAKNSKMRNELLRFLQNFWVKGYKMLC